jgi:hypothetical protein
VHFWRTGSLNHGLGGMGFTSADLQDIDRGGT